MQSPPIIMPLDPALPIPVWDSKDTVIQSHQYENKSRSNENFHEEAQKAYVVAERHKVLTALIAGCISGAFSKTAIAPFDRAKIHFQIDNKPFSMRAAAQFLGNTVRTTGFCSLWRGNSASLARIIPYAGIQFSAHEQFKILLKHENERRLPPLRRFAAGSLAGVTSVAATYPLDICRARMAVTMNGPKYKNIGSVFINMIREEGFRSLYRGFTPTILGSVPYTGTVFFTYETLKSLHAGMHPYHDPTMLERLLFGAAAGILGQTSSYPLDIVRRRMQTARVTGRDGKYESIAGTAKSVILEEGFIQGMYKGLTLNWIKGPIAIGISFSTFDAVKHWLRKLHYFREDDNM